MGVSEFDCQFHQSHIDPTDIIQTTHSKFDCVVIYITHIIMCGVIYVATYVVTWLYIATILLMHCS